MTKLVNKLCAETVSCWFEMESVRIHLSCFAVTVHFHVKKSDCMGSCLLKCLKETNAASSVTLMEEIYQLDFSPVLFHGVQSWMRLSDTSDFYKRLYCAACMQKWSQLTLKQWVFPEISPTPIMQELSHKLFVMHIIFSLLDYWSWALLLTIKYSACADGAVA